VNNAGLISDMAVSVFLGVGCFNILIVLSSLTDIICQDVSVIAFAVQVFASRVTRCRRNHFLQSLLQSISVVVSAFVSVDFLQYLSRLCTFTISVIL